MRWIGKTCGGDEERLARAGKGEWEEEEGEEEGKLGRHHGGRRREHVGQNGGHNVQLLNFEGKGLLDGNRVLLKQFSQIYLSLSTVISFQDTFSKNCTYNCTYNSRKLPAVCLPQNEE